MRIFFIYILKDTENKFHFFEILMMSAQSKKVFKLIFRVKITPPKQYTFQIKFLKPQFLQDFIISE